MLKDNIATIITIVISTLVQNLQRGRAIECLDKSGQVSQRIKGSKYWIIGIVKHATKLILGEMQIEKLFQRLISEAGLRLVES